MTAVRALAFGDLDDSPWGVAWLPAGADPAPVALGVGSRSSVVSARLEEDADGQTWRLEAEGVALLISPVAELAVTGARNVADDGFDQLCRVTGGLEIGGSRQAVDCLGWRAARELALDGGQLDSLRQISAWFEPGDGLALLALRPRNSRGQESDQIEAALRESETIGPISDPRLSTTYREDGRPVRAGVELWIGEDASKSPGMEEREDADHDDSPGHQYPRRLSGEALGATADWLIDGLQLHAELFRWHSRGRDGAGVYLLGTPAAP
jgi:hypothetical protein